MATEYTIPDDLPELLSDSSSEESNEDTNDNTTEATNEDTTEATNDTPMMFDVADYQYESDEDTPNESNNIMDQINDIHNMGLSPEELVTALIMWQMSRMNPNTNT
jgi:hypothetical protein